MKHLFLFLTVALCFCAGNKAMAQTVDSGTTGDCTWTITGLKGNYTLTISGNGAMADYTSSSGVPWYSYRSDIKTLDIQDGVTTIGNNAFYAYNGLTGALTIPNSVETIGNLAFSACTGLTLVTIGNAVETIGNNAFQHCSGLTGTLTIPNSVTSIGSSAFHNCSSLTSLTLGNSVETIGSSAFENSNKLTGLLAIPNSVTTIGNYAFSNCTKFTSVTLGNSVKTIGERAFNNCSNLTGALTIPNSVTNIESRAFAGCSNLTSVTLGNSVTEIGGYAFQTCTRLTGTVVIPNSVTAIGIMAFDDCPGLTDIDVDADNSIYSSVNGVLYNKAKDTLLQCPEGKTGSYAIPSSVKTIVENAFVDCKKITSVDIPNSVETIGANAFFNCIELSGTLTIPNSVKTIGLSAFAECFKLTSVILPNSLTTIEKGIFSHCRSLTSVTIPNSVKTIGESVFVGCTSLTSITIPESVTDIGASAFNGSGLTSVIIPNSVETIGRSAFLWCTNLVSVTISNSVTNIREETFSHCSSLTSVIIPNSVKTIGTDAFALCYDLTSVTLGNSVTDIGTHAFFTCTALTSIIIPNSLTIIRSGAFAKCGLTSVTLGNSVETIGNGIFDNCTGLTDLTVNWTETAKLPTLGNNSAPFSGVTTSDVNLHVPAGTTAIYEAADVWKDFKIVEQPGTSGTFGPDDEMEWELFPNDGRLVIRGESAMDFEGGLPPWEVHKYKVTNAVIAPGVMTIGESAFEGCAYLASVSIAEEASASAMSTKSAIRTKAAPVTSSLTTIEAYAFKGCLSLETIDIPASVTTIAAEAFADAGLQTVAVYWTEASAIPAITADVFPFQTPKSQMSPMTLTVPAGTKALYEAAPVWQDFIVKEEQAAATYTLTIGAFAGGVVTAEKTEYAKDEPVTLTIAPSGGYVLTTISARKTDEAATNVPLDGTGNTRTFDMPAYGVTVEAVFDAPATVDAETPVISGHPQSVTVTVASPVTLTVTAGVNDNGMLSYQWYSNTGDSNTGGTAITGATGSSYQPATATAGVNWYYVVVTNTNSSASGLQTATATSNAASVRVEEAPTGGGDPDPEPVTTYTVTIAPSANGQVTAAPWNAEAGETVTLTITSATGYELEAITAHRSSAESEPVTLSGTGDVRTFTMPAYDVTVNATFIPIAATGTEELPQAKALSAYIQNNLLCITGLTPGQPWSLYSITGALVLHKTADVNEAEITLPSRGIYIIQSGKQTIKIVY
jgi:hypothetical protein